MRRSKVRFTECEEREIVRFGAWRKTSAKCNTTNASVLHGSVVGEEGGGETSARVEEERPVLGWRWTAEEGGGDKRVGEERQSGSEGRRKKGVKSE